MRIHSPCLWPSLRQWSARCDFIRFACCPLGGNPVRVSQCNFVCYACCILCGAAALVTQCDYWLRLLPFLWQFMLVPRCDFIRQDPLRVNPALVAPLRGGPALAPVCDFTRHACCPLGSIGALDATFIRCSLGENPVRVCGSLFFVHRFARPFMPDFSRHSALCWDPSQSGPYLAFLIRV